MRPASGICDPAAGRRFAGALAGICLLVALAADAGRSGLRYEPSSIDSWQLWRLVTGHLTHLGWPHLVWNLLALGLLTALFERVMPMAAWCLSMGVSALTVSLGLYFFSPELLWYVGLSGILHGLAFFGAVRLVRTGQVVGIVLIAGLVAKLGWEQFFGALPMSVSASGGPVIVDAHLFGALGGVLSSILWIAHSRGEGTPL